MGAHLIILETPTQPILDAHVPVSGMTRRLRLVRHAGRGSSKDNIRLGANPPDEASHRLHPIITAGHNGVRGWSHLSDSPEAIGRLGSRTVGLWSRVGR